MNIRAACIILGAVLCVSLLAGCAAEMDIWVAGEMLRLTDRTAPVADVDVFDPSSVTITLRAAANDTACCQIVIDAGDEPTGGVTVKFTDLLGPGGRKIDSSNIKAYRMWPVRVDSWPGWYLRMAADAPTPAGIYDPLTDIDAKKVGQPFDIPAGGRLAMWVDLNVPRTAAAGQYTGAVTISAAGLADWTARIELSVYDFVLPDARPIATVGAFDHRTLFKTFVRENGRPYVPIHLDRRHPPVRKGLTIMRRLMQLAHAHRLDLFDREIHPRLRRDPDGSVQLDWRDYDAIVMPYLTGSAFEDRMGCAAWPMPLWQSWPPPGRYGGPDSADYASLIAEIARACREHFSATPEMAEQMFIWPYRGEVTQKAYRRHAALAGMIRAVDDGTPILSQLPAAPPAMTGWRVPENFSALADIQAPPPRWLDPSNADQLASPQHPLRGLWLTADQPPYLPAMGLLAGPADLRAVPWFAMKYNCTGLFIPEVLNWSGDPTDGQAGLFYPGTIVGLDEVLASVRLKRLRRGLGDIAGLWLLTQRRRSGIAKALIDAMVRYGGAEAAGDNYLDARLDGWVTDRATWQLAGRLLAEEVQAAVHPEAHAAGQALADQLRWRRLDSMARTVHLERVRTRTAPVRGDDSLPLRTTVLLDLYNQYGRGVAVSVKITGLPAGWHAIKASETIDHMVPATRQTVSLVAQGPDMPVIAEGKMPIEIEIIADQQAPVATTVYAHVIRPGRTAGDIKIDGRLDDWPMRPGNSAGKFRLVGRRGRRGDGLATRQSHAFVLRDRGNLYFAFRCQEPNPAGLVARADNMIRYTQLLAGGEDLVELILDPGAKANSVEQLYHVVVKANGVMIAERGVRSDPPLGKVATWAANASVAVGKYDDHWVAELRIPLAAFGKAAAEGIWGVDFTRFATQGTEASSWSGATRYFYDPKGLGTMLIEDHASPAADR